MTASLPKSRVRALALDADGHKRILMGLLMGLSLAALLSAPLLAAQETQDDKAQPEATEQTEPDRKKDAEEEADRRFFLGPRPELKRQVGPAVGKPRSILPQPFVPAGSITIPPAPDEKLPDDMAVDAGAAADAETVAQDQEAAADLVPENDTETTEILEGSLETLDPSGVAVLRAPEGFAARFWNGRDRTDVVADLRQYAAPTGSAVMSAVARKVALSGFVLPAPSSGADVDGFIKARLGVLAAHGDTQGYLALLGALSADHDWSGLARDIADGHLLAGRIEEACAVAAEERSDSNDAYWLRLATFCRAVRGDRVGVDFSLGILEEVSAVQPTFYQLADQILVEAEQASGAVLSNGMVLSNMLKVDVLEATMARLAKVQVPTLDMDGLDPLAAKAMLDIPGVAPAAKLQLIARGISDGWANASLLVDYLRVAPAVEDTSLDMTALMQEDMSFDADVMIMGLALHGVDEARRAEALAVLESRAQDPDKATYLLPALDYIAGTSTDTGTAVSRKIRITLMNGEQATASSLFTDLRASRIGDQSAMDAALLDVWPLMVAAGQDGAPSVTPERLNAWWHVHEADENRLGKAALLFTVLEALGHTVRDDLWMQVETGAPWTGGPSISPAHWRRLLIMAAEGDRPGALALAYKMTAGKTVSASFAGSMIGALKALQFDAEAHALAAEILVRRGL